MRLYALIAPAMIAPTMFARAGMAGSLAAAVLALSPAAWAAPVEVTRFHTPDSLAALDRSPVTVIDAAQTGTPEKEIWLEKEIWRAAVERALSASGFAVETQSAAIKVAPKVAEIPKVAEVRVEQRRWKPERQRGGVSVGVGGSAGSYGSGIGLGIGINLGGGSRELQATTLSVTIRDKTTGASLWEGRAVQTVKAGSDEARANRAADRLANALFTGFPGKAGETIPVK